MSAVNEHLNILNIAIGRADDAKTMAGIGSEATLGQAEKLIIDLRDSVARLPWSQDEEFQDIIEAADDILDEFKTESRSNWLVGAIADLVSIIEDLRDELYNG